MKKGLSSYLTVRYGLAIGLVFCILLFTLITFISQISTAKNDAYLINISGMQRMLSQRIGLMASEIRVNQSLQEAEPLIVKLETAVEKMRHNHSQLSSGNFENGSSQPLSEELQQMYHGSGKMDFRVNEFLKLAEQLLTSIKVQGLHTPKVLALATSAVLIARNGLLDDLNRIVLLYEKEASDRIIKFQKIEAIAFLFGVLVLLIEVLLIFRPMVRSLITKSENLEMRNKELIDFSYRISHDVRAPIKSLSGLVSVTEQAVKMDKQDTVITALGHMKTSIKQLDKLTSDIIGLTKTRMLEVSEESFNIKSLIEESITKFKFMDGFDKLSFTISCQDLKEINCKRLYVQQVLENLISNSIKYANFESTSPTIMIEASLTKGMLEINVVDNGIGIEENYRHKMFEMFQRFHPKVAFGSGLGLYLIAQNAKMLNGSIDYTALTIGSKFTLLFPVKRSAP